jgi:hypothetical protein
LGIISKYANTSKETKRVVKEPANLKMHFKLDTGTNYDKNAVDHRINT